MDHEFRHVVGIGRTCHRNLCENLSLWGLQLQNPGLVRTTDSYNILWRDADVVSLRGASAPKPLMMSWGSLRNCEVPTEIAVGNRRIFDPATTQERHNVVVLSFKSSNSQEASLCRLRVPRFDPGCSY